MRSGQSKGEATERRESHSLRSTDSELKWLEHRGI